MFYILPLEVLILRRELCKLVLVDLKCHLFISLPMNVGINPLTTDAAVEILGRVLLNAVSPFGAAFPHVLHARKNM